MIIHFGHPRTGTTFLQRHLFPALCGKNDFLYMGKFYEDDTSAYNGLSGFYRRYRLKSGDEFVDYPFTTGADPARRIAKYTSSHQVGDAEKVRLELIKRASNDRIMYSNESMLWVEVDDALSAIRFYRSVGAKVFLTIRSPVDWLISFYLYFSARSNFNDSRYFKTSNVDEFCSHALQDLHAKIDIFSIGLGGCNARKEMKDLGVILIDGIKLCSDRSVQESFCRMLDLKPVNVSGQKENLYQPRNANEVADIYAAFQAKSSLIKELLRLD